MTQEDFSDLLILWLSGVADMKNEKEIWTINEEKHRVTVEFPNGDISYAKVRRYWDSGYLSWETEYRRGVRDGYSKSWYPGGMLAGKWTYSKGNIVATPRDR